MTNQTKISGVYIQQCSRAEKPSAWRSHTVILLDCIVLDRVIHAKFPVLQQALGDLDKIKLGTPVWASVTTDGWIVYISDDESTLGEQTPEPALKNSDLKNSCAVGNPWTDEQIGLIRATVARNCTDTEFQLLLYLAWQYGLDPIRKQIWAVKYGESPAAIFTGRDGFLEIAHRSGAFDGMESGTRLDVDDLIGWATVYRKDMSHSFHVEVYMSEYTTKKNLWLTKPRVMITKVAESACLRKAFSVSGLYSPEEIPDGKI